jgi:hypothetical protein
MSGPHAHADPRRLYTTLREQTSAPARAKKVLEFLTSASGADGGYLFLAQIDGLQLCSSSLAESAPADLIAEAKRAWSHELDRPTDDNAMRTLEIDKIDALRGAELSTSWQSPLGETFERRLLSNYRSGEFTPVGLAMLRVPQARKLSAIRRAQLESICNALIDSGDVED